jgi:hypothetical protein
VVQGVLVNDSGVVDRLRAAWVNGLTTNSARKLVDARHLTECPRKVVSRVLDPASVPITTREVIREAMDARAKSIWMNMLEQNYNFRIDSRDMELVDSVLWLKTIVDAKIKVDGKSVVVIFRHASLMEIEKINTMGPMKKDVVTVAAAAHMAEVPDGVIIYSHGEDAVFHHVTAGSVVMDPISQKCKELCEYILTSKLPPPCSSQHCRFCE